MKKILALSVASFALAGALNAADLKIAGSSTVYPFTSFVAEEYAAIHNTKTPIVESLGTGGGFPGIPLAILFPDVQFHLVDSIGKKVRVATEVSKSIGLQNTTFLHARAEEEKHLFDFVVSRAVMPLVDLMKIIRKNISSDQQNVLPNGLICLKGGELENEAMPLKHKTTMWNLKDYFAEEFFETKKVVYVAP